MKIVFIIFGKIVAKITNLKYEEQFRGSREEVHAEMTPSK